MNKKILESVTDAVVKITSVKKGTKSSGIIVSDKKRLVKTIYIEPFSK